MSTQEPRIVKFNYITTNNYRNYVVEGVFGGLTPKGKIYAEFFAEKSQIPRNVKHEINKNGTLGQEIDRQVDEGIVRQIECGIIMDIDMAVAFRTWLDQKIDEYSTLSNGK